MACAIPPAIISKQPSEAWDETIRNLLDAKEMYDVTFIVGAKPVQIFPAHRLIVSAVSPEFTHLLNGVPRRGIVSIPHVDPDDFGVIMGHIYGKEVTIQSLQHSWNLLPLAKNYGLGKLVEKCKKYIIDCIDVKNACSIFEEAEYQEEGDIILESFKFMTKNAKYLFRGKGLIGAHSKTVAAIIRQDCINIDSEYQLFIAVLEWAKMECSLSKYSNMSNVLREIIKPLLPYIRILQLTHYQLMKDLAVYGVLTKEEVLDISLNLMSPASYKLPIWCNRLTKRRTMNSGFVEKQWRAPCLCIIGEDQSCGEATMTYESKMGIFVSGVGFRLSLKHSVFVHRLSAAISLKTEDKVETVILRKQDTIIIAEQIVKFSNPVYVKSGGWVAVTIEVDELSPTVHCCKIPPFMDNSPFRIIHGEDEGGKFSWKFSCFCVICYLSLT